MEHWNKANCARVPCIPSAAKLGRNIYLPPSPSPAFLLSGSYGQGAKMDSIFSRLEGYVEDTPFIICTSTPTQYTRDINNIYIEQYTRDINNI
jgi:hypothetical protein